VTTGCVLNGDTSGASQQLWNDLYMRSQSRRIVGKLCGKRCNDIDEKEPCYDNLELDAWTPTVKAQNAFDHALRFVPQPSTRTSRQKMLYILIAQHTLIQRHDHGSGTRSVREAQLVTGNRTCAPAKPGCDLLGLPFEVSIGNGTAARIKAITTEL
jgi:hypothetical protein